LCCYTYVKNKDLTSEVSTTDICDITVCSAVSNDEFWEIAAAYIFGMGGASGTSISYEKKKKALG
jgi:hypothetical protein